MTTWKFYDDNALRLFNDYQSIKFRDIFADVESYFLASRGDALDVGSGSGRDSAALFKMGYKVTAVEPSDNMRNLAAENHKHCDITWVNDSLPDLRKITQSLKTFDLIIVSAVWMHLSEYQQERSLFTLFNLLSANGVMIITLRLGPAEPDRQISMVYTEDLVELSKKVGLTVEHISPVNTDSFNRPSVTWQKVVLSKKTLHKCHYSHSP